MGVLELYVRAVDRMNAIVGNVVAWMTLGTVLVCFATVYFRYALDSGFIWMQEAYIWQHATVIFLGAGYTLLHNGHVRVDIFYAQMPARRRAMVDILGTLLFMAPFLWVMLDKSWGFFWTSYVGDERSQQPDGLQNLWILKSMLVWFCVVVGLQGLATIARSILFLGGDTKYAPPGGTH
jgi:TRAP-type mannitol/chloroaromatic compound transport system permease small subunit